MKALILDHFRRWGWVFAIGAVMELLLGWFGGHPGRSSREMAGFQFQIGLFMGAFLLSFDLQRGAARAMAALPLTARQIGRAWWMASVALPAAGFVGLLHLGAGAYWLMHPQAEFDWRSLMTASLYLPLMMGGTFPLVLFSGQVAGASGWRRLLYGAAGVAWGLMAGGGTFLGRSIYGDPVKLACFLAVGLTASAAGWCFTERVVVSRASYRAGTQIVSRRCGPLAVPAGFGGVPRLIGTTFLRSFLMGLAMIALMLVFFVLMGGGKGSWWEALRFFPGMGTFTLMFVMFLSVMPVMAHMRVLRSLPASPTLLAGALLAAALMPLTALQLVIMGLGWLVAGAAGLSAALDALLIMLPAAALVLVAVAQLGMSIGAYLALIIIMLVMQVAPVFWARSLASGGRLSMFDLVAAITGVVLLVISFWVIRWSFMTNSRLFRPPTGAFARMAWGAGR